MSTQSSDFIANGKGLKQAVIDIKKDYSLVYFAPDSKSVGKLDTGKCMAFSEYENLPTVAMKPLDGNLHTPESCKLNAGIIQSDDKWQNFMKHKKISNVIPGRGLPNTVERGLQYKVVEGYFADNPDFFKSANILSTGTAKKFDNITNSTNGYIKMPDSATQQPRYSVEWYGTFKPPMSGKWKFAINSGNASYMWIGKYAMSNMSTKNAIVNNGGLHEMRNVESGQITLQPGIPYPIRIQFGENSRGHDIQISIFRYAEKRIFEKPTIVKLSSGKTIYVKGKWKITYEWIPYKFEDFVTPEVNIKDTNLYYALVEKDAVSSSKGLYNCYISDTKNSNISSTKNNFKYKIIWSAFDEQSAESSKVQSGNYAYYRNNQLIICNKSGTILKQIGKANVQPICPDNAQTSGPDILKLDNNGNILIRGKSETKVNAAGALVNPIWITEKYVLNRVDTLTSAEGDVIKRTDWDNQQLLISENGKFKLEMTENGNLVIKESLSGCSGLAADGTKYTTAQDNLFGKNNYYLYEANADMKTDKMFLSYAKNNSRDLNRINVNGPDMKKGDGYTQYDNYAPSNTDNAVTVDNIAACKTKCTSDNNCDYYYSYVTKDGKNNCKTGTNNGLTPFIPIQPESGIKSSQLYIRTADMNLPSTDVRNDIPRITTSKYANYAAYNVSPALYELGDSEIMQKIKAATDLQKNIMNGTKKIGETKKINGFKGMEGFNDHGYNTSGALNAKYATQPTPDGLATAIQTHQITPLTQIAGDYNALMANINSEYNTISKNVSATTSMRDDLRNDSKSGYLDKKYEMMPHAKRVEDVRLDDINELISQTNIAYTLGTITAMTLIIAGIFVMRK